MANPHRGEVPLQLNGQAYTLRPSFQAIAELEQECGCGIVALARRFHDGQFSVQDVARTLHAGLSGAGNATLSLSMIGEQVIAQGLLTVLPALTAFLTSALGGHDAGGG